MAFAEGIRRIGAPRASAFIVLVPLLGEVLTFWLLGEEVGGFIVARHRAVVLAGLWLVQTARPPESLRTSAAARTCRPRQVPPARTVPPTVIPPAAIRALTSRLS